MLQPLRPAARPPEDVNRPFKCWYKIGCVRDPTLPTGSKKGVCSRVRYVRNGFCMCVCVLSDLPMKKCVDVCGWMCNILRMCSGRQRNGGDAWCNDDAA